MEESNNPEAKERILTYLELPEKIEYWQLKKKLFARIFYAEHSMIGSMQIGDPTDEVGTRSISPEYGAIVIADSEAVLQRKIDRATKRLALFNDLMPFLDIQRLLEAQRIYYLTATEYQALEAINEVEYYLEEQAKAEAQQRVIPLPENKELNAEKEELMQKLEAWGL